MAAHCEINRYLEADDAFFTAGLQNSTLHNTSFNISMNLKAENVRPSSYQKFAAAGERRLHLST